MSVTEDPPPGFASAFADPTAISAPGRRVYRPSAEDVARARELARGVVGTSDPGLLVARFVHAQIKPAYGLSRYRRPPMEVLESGRGDCLESHVVAAMLLRSIGVPCRFVTEVAAARFEPGQALAALLPRLAAGPFSNSHVWIETWVDGGWQPLDTQFMAFGRTAWQARRLRPEGGKFGFRFPLKLRTLDPEGNIEDDLADPYLLQPFSQQRGTRAYREWAAGVNHFSHFRLWDGARPFAGVRLAFEHARVNRMARSLAALLAAQAR